MYLVKDLDQIHLFLLINFYLFFYFVAHPGVARLCDTIIAIDRSI
jgi:hypothetical protein